jgi:hypothetical protein
MIKLEERALFTLLLLAFVMVLCYLTLGLGRAARLVPLAVIIPTLALLAFQLTLDLVPRLARKYGSLEKKDLFSVEPLREKSRDRANPERAQEEAIRSSRELISFLWLLAMLALLYIFGFPIALPVYTFLYLKRRSGESWQLSAAAAAGMCGLVYGVLILMLRVRLYEGRLWSWLGL